jgi:hypothetical protein
MAKMVMVLLHGDTPDGVGVGGGATAALQVHLALPMPALCLPTARTTTVRRRILIPTKM